MIFRTGWGFYRIITGGYDVTGRDYIDLSRKAALFCRDNDSRWQVMWHGATYNIDNPTHCHFLNELIHRYTPYRETGDIIIDFPDFRQMEEIISSFNIRPNYRSIAGGPEDLRIRRTLYNKGEVNYILGIKGWYPNFNGVEISRGPAVNEYIQCNHLSERARQMLDLVGDEDMVITHGRLENHIQNITSDQQRRLAYSRLRAKQYYMDSHRDEIENFGYPNPSVYSFISPPIVGPKNIVEALKSKTGMQVIDAFVSLVALGMAISYQNSLLYKASFFIASIISFTINIFNALNKHIEVRHNSENIESKIKSLEQQGWSNYNLNERITFFVPTENQHKATAALLFVSGIISLAIMEYVNASKTGTAYCFLGISILLRASNFYIARKLRTVNQQALSDLEHAKYHFNDADTEDLEIGGKQYSVFTTTLMFHEEQRREVINPYGNSVANPMRN